MARSDRRKWQVRLLLGGIRRLPHAVSLKSVTVTVMDTSVLAWSLTFLFGLQTSGHLTPLGGGQRFDFTTVDGFAQQCEYHVVLPEREREK